VNPRAPVEKPHGPLWRWLDERVGLAEIEYLAKKKEVPEHRHAFWYYFGGMTLFLFAVQVTTGILLLFYYRPSAEEAYESIQFLMAEVQFGWLIRSIHSWAANLMIFALFVHLFSVLLMKAYRPPREVTWMSGVGLMGLALAFGFTGYLLPWNELAYFATKVGTEIPGVLPVIGTFMRRLLRGGDEVTGATLTRFYGIHVAVLPALTVGLLGLHLFLVQRHGMSVPPSVERAGGAPRTRPFFPNYLLRDAVGWLCALAALATLAAFWPAELGHKADPFLPAPIGIKPEWYFMFMFQTLKYLPGHILGIEGELVGVLAFGLAGVFLLLVPFIDRRASRGLPGRLFTVIGLGIILYMLLLTYLGYTVSPTK
jgi:cytochrome b6